MINRSTTAILAYSVKQSDIDKINEDIPKYINDYSSELYNNNKIKSIQYDKTKLDNIDINSNTKIEDIYVILNKQLSNIKNLSFPNNSNELFDTNVFKDDMLKVTTLNISIDSGDYTFKINQYNTNLKEIINTFLNINFLNKCKTYYFSNNILPKKEEYNKFIIGKSELFNESIKQITTKRDADIAKEQTKIYKLNDQIKEIQSKNKYAMNILNDLQSFIHFINCYTHKNYLTITLKSNHIYINDKYLLNLINYFIIIKILQENQEKLKKKHGESLIEYNQILRVKQSQSTATNLVCMHLVTGQAFKKPMVEETLGLVKNLYEATDIKIDPI